MNRLICIVLICLFCASCSQEGGDEHASRASEAVLRTSEANTHLQEREYQAALTAMGEALALTPENAEVRLLYCMLLERTGEAAPAARVCYESVVSQLSQHPSQPCEQNINCVVAALMAGSDDADARKEYFLALPAPDAEAEIRRHVLGDFDRQAYLNTILP